MFGMAGGSAGQFVVGPLIAKGLPWNMCWAGLGILILLISGLLFLLLPKEQKPEKPDPERSVTKGFYVVFKNPQSILCGLIAGLIFIPTTIHLILTYLSEMFRMTIV